MSSLSRRFFTGLVVAWSLLAFSIAGGAPAAVPSVAAQVSAKPKLMVLIVIDGLPQRQLDSYRHQFAPDGFARFMERGVWFRNAHYDHAYTVTAVGHAVLLTGANPNRHGIIGNDWRDPQSAEAVYCTADRGASYIGHATRALDGTSPKNLLAESVGDVLRRVDPRAKVIAISGKDRGAILPAGRAGAAYMYMGSSGQFASSSYYMSAHPAWVDAFNAAKPADRYFKASWGALLPPAAYERGVAGTPPWNPVGAALPMVYSTPTESVPSARYYGSLLRGPFADALTLDFARAALAGEKLGQRDASDILSVSLSGHDYVNHAFGAESSLSHDHTLQLDRLLQAFFGDLDQTVGRDNYIVALSSDHGFTPTPEYSRSRGHEVERIAAPPMLARLNAGLAQRFGEGNWIIGLSASALLFDQALIVRHKVDRQALGRAARTLLLAEPSVAAAYTREELLGGPRPAEVLFEQMRKTWHAERSGDVQFALKPDWLFGLGTGATHGSPYAHDSHVPLMLWGPRWMRAAAMPERVGIVDLAPTLARLLGVAAPAQSEGRLLPISAP